MNTRTLIIPLALLLGAVLACAQTPVQRIHFLVAPGSTLTLNGTSTLHSYECSADSLTGTIESDTSGLAHNMLDSVFIGGKVEIPVKVLNNSSDGLKKNMAEALKGADFPVISFVLTHCAAAPDTLKQPGVWQINTTGNLTIAGKTLTIDLPVSLTRLHSGVFRLQGSRDLLMTDYGVDPPSFMFGAMKTNPKVTIIFDLILKNQ